MGGIVTGLYRHPIKGFTPERLEQVNLTAGAYFPCDRLFAIEDGPSGFDPSAPAYISKTRFTVLAKIAEVARAWTGEDFGSLVGQIVGQRAKFDTILTEDEARGLFGLGPAVRVAVLTSLTRGSSGSASAYSRSAR